MWQQFVVCMILNPKRVSRIKEKRKCMKSCQFEGGGLPTVHVQQQGGCNQKVSGWISWCPNPNKTLSRSRFHLWRVRLKSVSFCFSFAAVHECYWSAGFYSSVFAACGCSKRFFFFIVQTLVEGFPDMAASPLLTQKLEQTDVASRHVNLAAISHRTQL